MTDIEHQLITTRALLAEAGGTTVDVVARMVERIARLEEEVVELRRSVPVHPSSLTDVFTMLEADLAAETATRTALRTQESRISGILANAGVAAGDLVRGVASLVGQLEEARLQRVDAQAAAEEYRQACARLRSERDAARAEVAELRGLLDAMSAARAPASADELDAARMDAAAARADLAAETATRAALRTQESRISGILADAGVAVGDLVQGVAALVGQLEEARLQRLDAQAAAEEYRQACARLRAQVAALQDDNRQLGGREDWVREQALREAAKVLRDAVKKHRNDAEASRSVAASGGHVLAADILESYANVIDVLDAAPAAEVSDG